MESGGTGARRGLRQRARTLLPIQARDDADSPADRARDLDVLALVLPFLLLVLPAPACDALGADQARRVELVFAHSLPARRVALQGANRDLPKGRRIKRRRRIVVRWSKATADVGAPEAQLTLVALDELTKSGSRRRRERPLPHGRRPRRCCPASVRRWHRWEARERSSESVPVERNIPRRVLGGPRTRASGLLWLWLWCRLALRRRRRPAEDALECAANCLLQNRVVEPEPIAVGARRWRVRLCARIRGLRTVRWLSGIGGTAREYGDNHADIEGDEGRQ